MLVSIGMPVYNGEATVRCAIESLRQQSFSNWELVVSDNASSDQTSSIVASLAASDTRIRYVRQHRNMGAFRNFSHVLGQATGKYFMWAAADDRWHPDFISGNVSFLERNSDYVSSISKAVFDGESIDSSMAMGTAALTGTSALNLEAYLRNPAANTRFYAVHRLDILKASWIDEPFWAHDWAIMCRMLLHGKQHEIPQVMMYRSPHGASSNGYRAISTSDASALHKALPYLRFSLEVLRLPRYSPSFSILARLCLLNVDAALMMLRNRYSAA